MFLRTSALAALLCTVPCWAGLTRIVIEQRESPAFEGESFGKAGQYEVLSGHFSGELNPADAHNKLINDIKLAPKNARGMVEYTGTFSIAKPIDMSKSSSVLLYSVPNRGNGAAKGYPEGHVQRGERLARRSDCAGRLADDSGSGSRGDHRARDGALHQFACGSEHFISDGCHQRSGLSAPG